MLQIATLLVTPVLTGVAVGRAAGGRLANLATVRVRALWLLWSAAAIQQAQYSLPPLRRFLQDGIGVSMLAIVFAVVLLWLALNLPRWPRALQLAAGLILLGAVFNGLAIAANGRMPYAPRAAMRAHLSPTLTGPKHKPTDTTTRLAFLGDVLAVPPLGKVISPGDVLIAMGVSAAVAIGMRGRAGAAGENAATGARRPAGLFSDRDGPSLGP